MTPEEALRDLKSLSRAVKGGTLDPLRLALKAYDMGLAAATHTCTPSEKFNLAELEKDALTRAIAKTKNIVDAAALLGIGKTTAYRKLKEYGITVERIPDCCPKCGQPLLPLQTLSQAA